jgi:hypothetical protein
MFVALSLHSEYLLGYLAGAKNLPLREVIPFALIGTDGSPQNRALLKALALGMSDGRRNHALRQAHDVRIHVLALLARDSTPPPRPPGSRTSEPQPIQITNSGSGPHDLASEAQVQLEAFIQEAAELA